MPHSFEDFTQQLIIGGLTEAAEVAESLLNQPKDKRPADAQTLARELVKLRKLTKYQAEQVYANKAKDLV